MGLRRWYLGAIASAIDEGTACFRRNARWTEGVRRPGGRTLLSADYDPYNPAARFARQVRTALDRPDISEQYLGNDKKLLSLSLSFSYYSEEPADKQRPWDADTKNCRIGTTVFGEAEERTCCNFEIGNPTPQLPL